MAPAAFYALADEWRRREHAKDERAALIAFITARGFGMDLEFDHFLPHPRESEPENLEQINQRVKDVLSGLQ